MTRGINQIGPDDFRLLYDNGINVKDVYDISIITPNYNRGELLRNMLASLVRQEFDLSKVEIVIVDDGGEAKEIEIIKEMNLLFRARYYWQEHVGRRAGRVRNIGIKNAKGEIMLFLDSDALVSPTVLRDHFIRHKKRNKLVLLGDMFDLKKDEKAVFKKFAGLDGTNMPRLKFFIRFLRREFLLPIIYRITRNPIGVCFCTLHASAKREHILEINGFDEELDGRWGDEDLELGYRLEKLGLPVGWSGSSFVYHQWHPIKFNPGELDNRLRLFIKHPELIKTRKIGGLHNPFRNWSYEEVLQLNQKEENASRYRENPEDRKDEYRILFDNKFNADVKPEISLIATSYNRKHFIEDFLWSVENQSLDKKKFELIITDDGSNDGSLEFIKSKKLPFRLIYVWQKNKGFRVGSSRNNGIDVSAGDMIAITDMDVLIPRNFLEEQYKRHKECDSLVLSGLAFYSHKRGKLSKETLRSGATFQLNIRRLRWKLFVEKIRQLYLEYLESRKKFSLGTCVSSINSSFKKKDFYRVGKFDKDFDGIWGDEDIELSHRLYKAGVRVDFLNTTIAYHRWHEYAKSRSLSDENRLLFLIKHQELLKHRIINIRVNHYFNKSISELRTFYLYAKRMRLMNRSKRRSIMLNEIKEHIYGMRYILLPAFLYCIKNKIWKKN